jgi:hypothetical protein
VLLELRADAHELVVDLRHRLLERRDLLGRPDAGDDVLALGVDEVLAVEEVLARGGSRVKATPVPQSSPRLPKTIDWTLTAVPQLSGIELSWR